MGSRAHHTGESSRGGLEKIISKLLNINAPKNKFFDWSIIKEEDVEQIHLEALLLVSVSVPLKADL